MATAPKVSTLAIWGGTITAVAGLLQVMWTTKPWWLQEAPIPPPTPVDEAPAFPPPYPPEDSGEWADLSEPAYATAGEWEVPMAQETVQSPSHTEQSVAPPQIKVGILDFVIFFVGVVVFSLGIFFRRKNKGIDIKAEHLP
jgi:hypothetical protein